MEWKKVVQGTWHSRGDEAFEVGTLTHRVLREVEWREENERDAEVVANGPNARDGVQERKRSKLDLDLRTS